MYNYAQTDHSGIVVGLSQLSDKVNEPHMILIETYDETLIGKRWTGKVFEEIQKALVPKVLSQEELTIQIHAMLTYQTYAGDSTPVK